MKAKVSWFSANVEGEIGLRRIRGCVAIILLLNGGLLKAELRYEGLSKAALSWMRVSYW